RRGDRGARRRRAPRSGAISWPDSTRCVRRTLCATTGSIRTPAGRASPGSSAANRGDPIRGKRTAGNAGAFMATAGGGAGLAFLFAMLAFRDESALALGERDVSPGSVILVQLARSVAFGLVGPTLVGCLFSAAGVLERTFR